VAAASSVFLVRESTKSSSYLAISFVEKKGKSNQIKIVRLKCRLENEWQRNCQMVDCAVDDNGSSAIHNTRAILFDAAAVGGEKGRGRRCGNHPFTRELRAKAEREREIGRVGRRNLELGRRTRLSSKWVPLSSRMAYVFIKEKSGPLAAICIQCCWTEQELDYWARRRMFLIDKSTEDKSLPFCLGTRDTLVVPPHSFHPFSSFLYCAGSSFLGFIEARISQQHTGVIETIKD
jgi:hypothetical protein